jgi:hypothetical protein
LAADALRVIDERDHQLTDTGRGLICDLGVEPTALDKTRRIFARTCVDWTQRRPHLAGALPAALTNRFLETGWLVRASGRALRVTSDYDQRLDDWLGPP